MALVFMAVAALASWAPAARAAGLDPNASLKGE
jgi:ABC-type lipoprotein release transport system permease subunit